MNSQMQKVPDTAAALSTWLCYLETLHQDSIKLGLDRIEVVAQRLAVLEPAPYVITVTGTNGKGTTCRMLEAVLLESGYRVGVYSSPHLLRYNERIRINNHNPSDSQLTSAFHLIAQKRYSTPLTYFEVTTLAALLLFKQARLDVVILEVGLGGRLDATNIVDSDISVITTVDLDHIHFLGNSRESIGREKAGIFRPDKLAVIGEPMMPQSIFNFAARLNTQLNSVAPNINANWGYTVFEDYWSFYSIKKRYDHLPLPHIPIANAATALATLIHSSLVFDEAALKVALATAKLPGRIHLIRSEPMVIVDVAHNPQGAGYLNQYIASVKKKYNKRELRYVIGMLADKDIKATLSALSADYWYCGSLSCARGATAANLAQFLPPDCTKTFASIVAAWQFVLAEANKDDIIIVCGSFHTVAEVMENISYE